MKSVKITLTTAGAGTGPFNIYSNIDQFTTPFETNIAKSSLEAGYTSTSVPDAATTIRVESTGTTCSGFYTDLAITGQSQETRSIAIDLFIDGGTPTLTAFKNGVSYLTRSTAGNSYGSITPGDTFAGRITTRLTTVDLEVFSTTRGSLYAVYDSDSTISSPTYTLQSGEDINIHGSSYSACLVAGTLVTLHDNTQVPIETLKIGDILKSVQIEGLEDTNNVVELKKWESNELTLSDTYSKVSEISKETVPVTLTFNEGLLKGSTRHVQLVKRAEEWRFLRFGEIKIGDIFINENQEEIEIQTIDMKITPTEVYKVVLEEPSHTFYANNIITHNIK